MPPFRISMTVSGDAEIARKAMRTSEAAARMQPALKKIGDVIRNASEQTFRSQGRRGGGSWRFLQPATVRRRMRAGQGTRILYATGALYRSMTTNRSPYHFQRIEGGNRIIVGSSLPYARTQHQTRPLVKFVPSDKVKMSKILGDHLVGHWRSRRRKPSTW